MAAEPENNLVPAVICEVCWLIEHTNWEPESVNEDGDIIMRLTGVDVPEKINTESVDVCSLCGSITVAGIYEMRDPDSLIFTVEKDEEDEYIFGNDPTAFVINMKDFENPMDDM